MYCKEYKFKKDTNIVILSDWHKGHKNFNKEVLDQFIKYMKLYPNSRILLLGDMLECATKKSIGAGCFEQDMGIQKQLEWLVYTFKPYKDNIDLIVDGNHENRIKNDSDVNILKIFNDNLGIDSYSGYSGLIQYSIGDQIYSIYGNHGSGSGSTISTAVNSLKKMSNVCLANIYVQGHFHKRFYSSKELIVPIVGGYKKINQYFISNGSALSHNNGYADASQLEAYPLGMTVINLNPIDNRVIVNYLENLI